MKERTGSALLVVLGMLAFMVVSGLAFSVFMRSTRMSSSFTRRTATTRQFAKAALAEAIDAIDRAVANDPHPNVRLNNANEYNHWLGRVLVTSRVTTDGNGNETVQYPRDVASTIGANPEKNGNEFAVPVLSLEALAYLPPPLVNEARYFGQKVPSASWQTLSFDAGRYAFLALDVSDYFDVNRLVADEGRSSNPSRRVTFSHLFENTDHSSAPSGTDAWETFMDPFRTVRDDGTFDVSSKLPLVSLADFNLALGSQALGGMKSPFVQYLQNGSSGNGFYGATPGSSQFEKYAAMTFVTDSLDAPIPAAEQKTDSGETILDLDDEGNQIFTEAFLDAAQENRPLLSVSQLKTEPFNRLVQNRIPYVTMFNLSDYLDSDRIPISLGIPSVERVPMICGIKPILGNSAMKVTVDPDADTTTPGMDGVNTSVQATRVVHWRIDPTVLAAGFMGGMVQVLVVYPFRNHEQLSESSYFKIDGKVQVFLSSDPMYLRTGNANDLLHWGGSVGAGASSGGTAGLGSTATAILNLPLAPETISLQSGVMDQSKCVQQVNLSLASSASAIATGLAGDLLTVTYNWQRTLNTTTGQYDNDYANVLPTIGGAGNVTAQAISALRPLKQDGTVDTDFPDTLAAITALSKTLRLNFVVTLRITSSDDKVCGKGSSGTTKTVDMVPATLYDDELNGINNSMGVSSELFTRLTGLPTPLMKFDTGISFPVTLDPSSVGSLPATPCSSVPVTLTVADGKEASVMVDDPRYNHAPENWKVLTDFSANGWLKATTAADRDGDIFMATSDQGYLQSVYEFAFLPRLSNLEQYGDAIRGNLSGYSASGSAGWENLCQNNPIDADFMWWTYDIFGRYGNNNGDGDDFEGLGLENLGRGLRVNPYSDSTNVIMAAFANTPRDWRAASENEEENAGANLNVSAFNKKYAWNEYSSGAKLAWEDLEEVAGTFMGKVSACAGAGESWKYALEDLFNVTDIKNRTGQADGEQYLCGIQLESPSDKLYGVDKKFLYGYWRNSFAARQQLYLVFFRAEPMMMGGGVAGVTPPQLGAKGVAVVWRNPNLPTGANTGTKGYAAAGEINSSYIPHQTRVLFYRQFE